MKRSTPEHLLWSRAEAEEVERVARAMWEARGREPRYAFGVDMESWEAALPSDREMAKRLAVAAILEMRR